MASAAVARGWLQRWAIPHKVGRDSPHTHQYARELVYLVPGMQSGRGRAFLVSTYLPRAKAGASTDTLIALLRDEMADHQLDRSNTATIESDDD